MVDTDQTVRHAGGFIIQLMPEATEETISALEQKMAGLENVTAMMEKGMGPKDILQHILEGLNPEFLEETPVRFHCDCSKEKIAKALITLGKDDLKELISEEEGIEVKCHFCNSAYKFTSEELKALLPGAEE